MKKLSVLFSFCITVLIAHEIDIVIPCVEKDLYTLDTCIAHVKKNIEGVRRVIVVSKEQLTEDAEWFDEAFYPFTMNDIADSLLRVHKKGKSGREGWYFQQMLKMYAPFVIPDISENVMVVDADTFFLKPFSPLDESGKTVFFTWPTGGMFANYLNHMKKVHPSLQVNVQGVNPVVNFMLFQKEKVESLFALTKEAHGDQPFWEVFTTQVDPVKDIYVGASEYTIYFFFMTNYYPDDMVIRSVKMQNRAYSLADIEKYSREGFDVISCHHYYRK